MNIGVFDSGLGGLTVVREMLPLMKNADIYYIADTQHAPYGEKSQDQILSYALNITEYFLKYHQIDTLVIACNTATSAAVSTLRTIYPQLLIVGTEPAVKPAIEKTKTGKVGVLATPATLKGDKYQQLANRLSTQKKVTLFEQACPGLVEQIERGKKDDTKTLEMLNLWLKPMREKGVDTIVLGCTHYPLVSKQIESIMHNNVHLLHTGAAIAKRVIELNDQRVGAEDVKKNKKGSLCIMSTDTIAEDIIREIVPSYECFRYISLEEATITR